MKTSHSNKTKYLWGSDQTNASTNLNTNEVKEGNEDEPGDVFGNT